MCNYTTVQCFWDEDSDFVICSLFTDIMPYFYDDSYLCDNRTNLFVSGQCIVASFINASLTRDSTLCSLQIPFSAISSKRYFAKVFTVFAYSTSTCLLLLILCLSRGRVVNKLFILYFIKHFGKPDIIVIVVK